MHLKEGSFLKGGEFRIEEKLGQGGFGITYLGLQVGLNRKVAIKEFFMKEYCNRDEETSRVTVPSLGSQAQVERFREKFVKEAQTIASLENNHIIRIYDVFQENGTAYYVMEYHENGSLLDLVKHRGGLNETDAVSYIRQMASALQYIHGRKIAHLDIKPSNVLLDSNGHAVLIDFGMSKRYDDEGEQTSTTPVGISHGYAPLEQYKKGGVGIFSPASDIYSLGATLYKLVTGVTPPDASEVETEELSASLSGISAQTRKVILQAMQLKSKNRPQSVDEFLSLLDASEVKVIVDYERTIVDIAPPISKPAPQPRRWFVPVLVCLIVGLYGLMQISWPEPKGDDSPLFPDTLALDCMAVVTPVANDSMVYPQKPAKVVETALSTTSLYVSTSPNGATVYVDGKKIGKSPIEGDKIARGKHTVKIVLEGYETFSRKYTLGDEPMVINETLTAESILATTVSGRTSEKEDFFKPEPAKIITTGTINGHEYVDLGLSVKWAKANVGAKNPNDFGSYFVWGEVHSAPGYNSLSVRHHWGSGWRLPTKAEFLELLNNCKWTWNPQGYYKVVGPNGNSINLPASGFRNGKTVNDVNEGGYYWCSSSYGGSSEDAYFLYFYSGDRSVTWGNVGVGRSVRFVSK